MRRFLLMAMLPVATTIMVAGCGGGSSKSGATPAASTTAATASGTRVAATANASPGAKTNAAGTTIPGATPAAAATTVAGAQTGDVTPIAAGNPATGFEATIDAQFADPTNAAALGSDGAGNIAGGNPGDPRHIVVPVPAVTPDPGVAVTIDPTQIAPPEPASTELTFAIDTDASTAGVQTTRTVHVGDTIVVAVALDNVPSGQGVSAFNFIVNYDKTKIFAPTIAGGPSVDRNPDLNVEALGADAGWACLPAPEGDLDDPGGTEGDGNPATGQAFLSCFTPQTGHASGNLVVATITFHVIAKGSTDLSLSEAFASGEAATEIGSCNPQVTAPIGCAGATITVD